MTWLERTPMAVVLALAESMDRLNAEEAMEAAAIAAVGNTELEPHARRAQWAAWERAAGGDDVVRATPVELAAIGIGFKQVPKGEVGG